MKRLFGTVAVIAATCLSVATPALAQSSADDARFAAAQSRLDSELQIFRQEFDRYQSVRGNRGGYAPQGGYRTAPDRSGGYQEAYPDERDEGAVVGDPRRRAQPAHGLPPGSRGPALEHAADRRCGRCQGHDWEISL